MQTNYVSKARAVMTYLYKLNWSLIFPRLAASGEMAEPAAVLSLEIVRRSCLAVVSSQVEYASMLDV